MAVKVIEFRDNDSLVSAHIVTDDEYVFAVTANAVGCKFKLDTINAVKSKTGMGVRLMRLKAGDRIVSSVILSPDMNEVCMMTSMGYAKKIDTSLLISKGRGSLGQKVGTLSDDDFIVDATIANNKTLFIVTVNGMIIRIPTDSINTYSGLTARGIKAIRLDDDDRVMSISIAPDSGSCEEEEEASDD